MGSFSRQRRNSRAGSANVMNDCPAARSFSADGWSDAVAVRNDLRYLNRRRFYLSGEPALAQWARCRLEVRNAQQAYITGSRPFSRAHRASLHDGAIDYALDLLTVVLPQFAGGRRSYNHHKTLLRVTEELRAVRAIPGELARVAGNR